MRKVEIWKEDSEWTEASFKDIKKGTFFKIYDNEDVVKDEKGKYIFEATTDAYVTTSGHYRVSYKED
jgi:acyl-coenzyme A synthetase/AMP-(fatty) acid ligase